MLKVLFYHANDTLTHSHETVFARQAHSDQAVSIRLGQGMKIPESRVGRRTGRGYA